MLEQLYLRKSVCMCVHLCVCVRLRVYQCLYVCVCVYMHACLRVFVKAHCIVVTNSYDPVVLISVSKQVASSFLDAPAQMFEHGTVDDP